MAKTVSFEELKALVEKKVAYFEKEAKKCYSTAAQIEIATGTDDSKAEGYYLAGEDYDDLASDFTNALNVMHNANVYGNCKAFGLNRKPGSPMAHYIFTALNHDGKVVHLVDVATYLP